MRVWFRAMHLLAQGKKGLSNIELGRRLGISTNAAWRVQHKLMQAMIERDRRYKLGASGPRIEIDDAYIGGERTGEGSGRGRRGHTPFIIAVETAADGRPLYARLQVVRGFEPPKPSDYAPVSKPERPSSATADSGFNALRGSRVSSTSATSPAPIEPPPDTPPSAGQTRSSPTSKQPLAAHRAVAAKHLPRYLGAFAWRFQPPLRSENNPRATGHRRRGDPANALSPPQTG